jgi:hypothetical protein
VVVVPLLPVVTPPLFYPSRYTEPSLSAKVFGIVDRLFSKRTLVISRLNQMLVVTDMALFKIRQRIQELLDDAFVHFNNMSSVDKEEANK